MPLRHPAGLDVAAVDQYADALRERFAFGQRERLAALRARATGT